MDKRMQPWNCGTATENIRKLAKSNELTVTYTLHSRERLKERELILSDVLYALKHGFVYTGAVASTRNGFYKYRVECKTPNSEGRSIGIVVIPNEAACLIKIVTVMWLDEYQTRAGSIIGVKDDE